jgi:hypothetical protein
VADQPLAWEELVVDHEAEDLEQRSRFLSIVLSVMGASVFLFFLFLACGGLAVPILAVMAGLGVFGLIHYLLWGYAFSAQVTEEAEEEARREPAEPGAAEVDGPPESQGWTPEERSWYRRF